MNSTILEFHTELSKEGLLSDREITTLTDRIRDQYLHENNLHQPIHCDYGKFFGFKLGEIPFHLDHYRLFYKDNNPAELHISPYPNSLREGSVDKLKEWMKERGFSLTISPYSFYGHGRTIGIKIVKTNIKEQ